MPDQSRPATGFPVAMTKPDPFEQRRAKAIGQARLLRARRERQARRLTKWAAVSGKLFLWVPLSIMCVVVMLQAALPGSWFAGTLAPGLVFTVGLVAGVAYVFYTLRSSARRHAPDVDWLRARAGLPDLVQALRWRPAEHSVSADVQAAASRVWQAAAEALVRDAGEAAGEALEVALYDMDGWALDGVVYALLSGRDGPQLFRTLRMVMTDVDLLRHVGVDTRQAVAGRLESLGWQPASDGERALCAIAREDWATALSLGAAGKVYLTVAGMSTCLASRFHEIYHAGFARIIPPALLAQRERQADFVVSLEWIAEDLGWDARACVPAMQACCRLTVIKRSRGEVVAEREFRGAPPSSEAACAGDPGCPLPVTGELPIRAIKLYLFQLVDTLAFVRFG